MSQNNLHVCCLIYLTFIHPRQIIRLDNSFRYLMCVSYVILVSGHLF